MYVLYIGVISPMSLSRKVNDDDTYSSIVVIDMVSYLNSFECAVSLIPITPTQLTVLISAWHSESNILPDLNMILVIWTVYDI